jgi:hypothetical protein
MKWSKLDVERFKRGSPDSDVISVDGNILVYSVSSRPPGTLWKFRAKLVHGGESLSYTVHSLLDDHDLFE